MARRGMSGRRWWHIVQVVAGIVVLFFAARQIWRDWDEIRASHLEWHLRPLLVLGSILITLAMYALLIWVWRCFLQDWGQQLGGWTAARIWTIANLGKYIPGKIWAIAGLAIMAQRQGVAPWAATASAVVLQGLAVGTGVAVAGLAGTRVLASVHPWVVPALWTLAIASAVGVFLLVSPAVNRLITRRVLGREPAGSPRPGTVLLGIGVNLAAWAGYGVSFWLLARGTLAGVQLSLVEAISAFTTSYLAGLLFLLAPGGLFVRESIMILMLQGSIGLAPAGALAVASRLMLTLTEIGVAVPFLVLRSEKPSVTS
ncbi:MAG: lysylphosphatidylglycerol synthase domain-containing protein [Gemmatimonadota bacterium]